jgi:hypothetical protein
MRTRARARKKEIRTNSLIFLDFGSQEQAKAEHVRRGEKIPLGDGDHDQTDAFMLRSRKEVEAEEMPGSLQGAHQPLEKAAAIGVAE